MKLRVLGCHGGASLRHRNVSFLIDGRVAMDAGGLASALTLAEQGEVDQVLVSHSHMDHVGELGSLVEQRAHGDGPALTVAGMMETIEALQAHFFNDVLWPDFTRIPSAEEPSLRLRTLALEESAQVGGLEVLPIPVHHSVPSCGFVVDDGQSALAYTGDTGPTERFWEVVARKERLGAIVTEVSFPDHKADLAGLSGHLTPATLQEQISRLGGREVPILVYGMKPAFEDQIRDELAPIQGFDIRILEPGDQLEV